MGNFFHPRILHLLLLLLLLLPMLITTRCQWTVNAASADLPLLGVLLHRWFKGNHIICTLKCRILWIGYMNLWNDDNNDDLKPLTSKAHAAATTTRITKINNNGPRHHQDKIHKVQRRQSSSQLKWLLRCRQLKKGKPYSSRWDFSDTARGKSIIFETKSNRKALNSAGKNF